MATHKKDRPMLSVTSLLYGSPSPNSSLFNNNNNNNNVTMTSPNGLNNNGLLNNNMNNDNTSPIGCGGGGGGGISHTNQTILNSPTQIQQQLNCNSPTAMNNNNYNILTNNNNNNNNNDCDNNNNIININNNNNNRYPPNHPLSGSKHLCAICEDRASGKHYGVYSCEGCKGFFKRTVRKDLTYVCRDDRNCIVDKRQRNRCQYCRYQKCLDMGMKREAVQEERQRNKPSTTENEPESSTNNTTPGFIHTTSLPKSANRYNYNHHHLMNNNTTNNDARIFNELNIERLTEAEKLIEINTKCSQPTINIATKEIELLFEWIRNIPYFSTLDPNDQLVLLKNGWNELLIAEFSYRSRFKQNSLLLANGMEVSQQMAQTEYIGEIFNRVLNELVAKMREMQMDSTELGCLRAIVLFNPALKNLKNPNIVEKLRECVYSLLECYCKQLYPDKTSRFAKLLVRLPALRSIGLKCIEPLFLQQYLAENNLKHDTDSFISCMLMRLK